MSNITFETAPQHGRTYVVTGGNAGLGYFASEQLAAAGARVVVAARDPERARGALAAIRRRVPAADLAFVRLDLADLASVRRAAAELAELPRIDGLLANAGVIGSRVRRETTDGFELNFGTNHLGHFALIATLLPVLEAHASRIVHVGSMSHLWAHLDFDDLMRRRHYASHPAYAASKLAVMMFGFELAQRFHYLGRGATSLVAHPGFALSVYTPVREGVRLRSRADRPIRRGLMRAVAQGKDTGAWPLVQALTDPAALNGQCWGPGGFLGLKGLPAVVAVGHRARERNAASRLITASERLTGVTLAV